MSGYRYRGKPFLSSANRDIMTERSGLSETELAQRLGELDKHIREYPYIPVRPLTSADVLIGGRESYPNGNRPPSTHAEPIATEDQNAGRMACATPPGRA